MEKHPEYLQWTNFARSIKKINKLMKKLLGISLEVHGITSFRFFSQDMAETWCIDLLGKENSPSAELACLFSLTKKTRVSQE